MMRFYEDNIKIGKGEFYILPLLTTIGLLLLCSSTNLIMIFISLELVTISFYILVSYQRNLSKSLEAGVKYLIIGALSTGFLVYGIAFVYGSIYSLELKTITENILQANIPLSLIFALILITVGIGFKISSVPFHSWAPDVYQGAPTPVTAFLASSSKIAGFVILLRILFFDGYGSQILAPWVSKMLIILGVLSVVLGNFAALAQRNVKRMLAYSGIGHAGFVLLALGAYSQRGLSTTLFYLYGYALAVLLVFLVLSVLSNKIQEASMDEYAGLGQRSPILALGLTIGLLSMAGIPPLIGFTAKFSVLAVLFEAGLIWPMVIALIAAVAGLVYYLYLIRAMYWLEPKDPTPIKTCVFSRSLVLALGISLIFLGFWQSPIAGMSEQVIRFSPRLLLTFMGFE
jgi:NADH-quinone oxidoreductase subunit N